MKRCRNLIARYSSTSGTMTPTLEKFHNSDIHLKSSSASNGTIFTFVKSSCF